MAEKNVYQVADGHQLVVQVTPANEQERALVRYVGRRAVTMDGQHTLFQARAFLDHSVRVAWRRLE